MHRDFRDALDTVLAMITPQPWDYTAPDGTTLTVIPDGTPAYAGDAEVFVRITADKALAAQIDIPSRDMPELITALRTGEEWEYKTFLDAQIAVATDPGDASGWVVTVSEHVYDDATGQGHDVPATIRLPDEQRLPLASALARALDVAHGWERD